MIRTKVTIKNKLGLHARASAKFVATAMKFHSQIKVTKDNNTINGKSIMGVLMLVAAKGTVLDLEIEGSDEQQLEKAIVDLINSNFGEPE